MSERRQQVYLVRHGRTALNADGRLRGRLDPPLDDVGRAEAQSLAESMVVDPEGVSTGPCTGSVRFQPPVLVVTSPLRRAVETGDAIARAAAVGAATDMDLVDRDYGGWTGHRELDVISEFGGLDGAPGVEAADDVLRRALRALEAATAAAAAGRSVGPVVVVAHDAVNRLLLAFLSPSLGQPERIRQRTGCANLLTYAAHRWRVDAVDVKPASVQPVDRQALWS
jgi:broad specificity phosphatase PhoE